MKRFFTLIILCLFIYACKPGVPKDIIQPDKMEKVLIDIHIVDGYLSTLNLPSQDTSKKVAAPLYNGVYKKFEIDSALYNRSLDYYYNHPDVMKKMYDSISVKLTILKEQVTKEDLLALEYSFKGIFDASAKDSTQYDPTLDRRYNYRYLIKQRYGNFGNVLSVSMPPPIAMPTPVPTEVKPALDTLSAKKTKFPVQ
ncbi:DUF4296 domain-containing protein [Pedobacter frigiditerrae]|uniref:DUF4296 domain-containing protein n=1 Tax=Pedobacter frigiditerrae TaxID=2530452 RepID=UPI002931278F|nr:DUF4296 domain-containing protein [Pedobacter frigiditerrae]